MEKKQARPDPEEAHEFPVISEESNLGVIKINHSVVATIVKLASLEVAGVIQVGGGGFVDEIAGIFSKKETGAGILVEENEHGSYNITVRVILAFGVDLAKTAYEVQRVVREQVVKMTSKRVAKIDVMIEGVRLPDHDRTAHLRSELGDHSAGAL